MRITGVILSVIKNKFVIATLAFAVWMLFFDQKDWGTIKARSAKLDNLKKSERALTEEINKTAFELNQLKANAKTIEKYARENIYMKKDNEDLFIVKSSSK